MNYKDLINLQAKQFERLLNTKRLSFRNAYYVIFSDYPTATALSNILATNKNYSNFSRTLDFRIGAEYLKLSNAEELV